MSDGGAVLQFPEPKRHACRPCWDDLTRGAEIQLYHLGVVRVCVHLARGEHQEAERICMLSGQLEEVKR